MLIVIMRSVSIKLITLCVFMLNVVAPISEAGLLNKNSGSAQALVRTKVTNVRYMIFVALKSDLDAKQTHLRVNASLKAVTLR